MQNILPVLCFIAGFALAWLIWQAKSAARAADLQARLNLTYVFISHDLAVVETISSEVAVMHLGKIVERGPRSEIFANPKDDYTRLLLSSIPGLSVPQPA